MTNTKIRGFYDNYMLVEHNGTYYVTKRQEREVLFKGSEEEATKLFVMLIAGYVDERIKVEV